MTLVKNIQRTNLHRELLKNKHILDFLQSDESIDKLFDLDIPIPIERRILYKELYRGNGSTPVYELPLSNNNVLHIKLECENRLGNNHYSRYWLPYLFLAEGLNIIQPYETKIIEVTSGSSGISMSLACEQLGYDLTMIIPESLPEGRTKPMLQAGTKLIRAKGYIDECVRILQEMIKKDDNYFAANHSEEKSNLITYIFSRIAVEYQVSYGNPDIAILGLGNGTSTEAVASKLKQKNSSTKIFSYYPSFDSKQVVLGLYGPNVTLRHIKPAMELVDTLLYTSDIEIESLKEKFANNNIISNLGLSSLYAIRFAEQLADNYSGLNFFSIAYDKIERYKSTDGNKY
jgi:cysteine synthase